MTNCPKCGQPAEVVRREVLGERVSAVRCKACRLIGVEGSPEPWLPSGTLGLTQLLLDMQYRVDKARAVQQERYRDLETK
jgi:hypothetical protein